MKIKVLLFVGFLLAASLSVSDVAAGGYYHESQWSRTQHSESWSSESRQTVKWRSTRWCSSSCGSSQIHSHLIYECRPVARVREVPGHWERKVVIKDNYVPGYKVVEPLNDGYRYERYEYWQPPFEVRY